MMATPKQEVTLLNVFLASPSDVLDERKAAIEVVENRINHTLSTLQKPYRLEIRSWERDSYPSAGRPGGVILEQIPIEDCDIFIAIFWSRFGSPPGGESPSDGRPYLSGTEEEIDRAFDEYRKSGKRKPHIMLYRRLPTKPPTTDDERIQVGDVARFFTECRPDGKYPALISMFEDGQFAESLEQHLLQVVVAIEGQHGAPNKLKPIAAGGQDSIAGESEIGCLARIGLKRNPFSWHVAEDEKYLLEFYVPIGGILVPDLLREPRHIVFFAERGSGKSALRIMLQKSGFPSMHSARTMVLTLGKKQLADLVQGVHRGNPKSVDYAKVISREALACLHDSPVRWNNPANDSLADLRSFAYETLRNEEVTQSGEAKRRLEQLMFLARQADLEQLIVVVDQVDEVSSVTGDFQEMVNLLEPILVPDLRDVQGISFMHFLPTGLREMLNLESEKFRLDRVETIHLRWSANDIVDLVQERMIKSSIDQEAPLTSLAQLCDSRGDFSIRIDDELIQLAQGSQRAVLWLSNRLLLKHCAQRLPPYRIQPTTWEAVKIEWEVGRKREILGVFFEMVPFIVSGSRLLHKGSKINLSKKSFDLLCCLIEADGGVCEMTSLARAGWPEADPAGVSKDAIREAMLRLKKQFQDQGIDPNWIENIRGRGYRLKDSL